VSLYTVKSDTALTDKRKVFPKGSVLSISGDNENSLPKAIYVTLNQTEEELYKDPIKLTAKGRHTVKIRAIDKDNNETTLSITYLIVE
jgi:putative lipoic acid-binding regulatory protein